MPPMQLVGIILQWALVGLIGLIIFLVVSMLLARLYNLVALGILNNLFAIFGIVLRVIIGLLEWIGKEVLDKLYSFADAGLRQAWSRAKREDIARNLGALDVLGASFFFILFLILIGSDMYFAAVRMPELFHVTPPNLNPDLFTPVIVSFWVSVIVVIGAAAADVFGLTHLLPPYVGAQSQLQRALRIGALVSVGLLILAGMLQGLYSWELASSTPLPIVDAALSVLLFVLGFIATLAIGIPAPYEALAFLVLFPSLVRFIPTLLAFLINAPLNLLDVAAAILVNLYGVAAALGHSLWNAFAESNFVHSRRLPFKTIKWETRTNIGDGIKLHGI